MQPHDWLKLAGKSLTDVSVDMEMNLVTVLRHFRGTRHPGPDVIRRYEEYTKGAVKAQDWVDLWNEPDAVSARAVEEEKRLATKAATA